MLAMKVGRSRLKKLTDEMLRAISHPLRLDIQCILFNRVASPNEIAKELGEQIGTITHHIDVLKDEGIIKLVDSKQRRGATEHFYRAVSPATHDDRAWAKLSKSARKALTTVTLRGVIGEAVRAVTHDTFDARDDRHLSWTPMELDEQGWQELRQQMGICFEELERIKAEAKERLGAEKGKRFVAALMGYETPPGLGLTDHH